ncbi:MAG: ester cyclase [Chitinophagaceae bacterium]|nr:ester cyclase [Chitinophagaceae bacterium]
MKKLVVIISAASILMFSSCTPKNEGGMSEKAKKNLETSQAISKTFETKDFSKLGDYIADNCVDHAGENGDIVGLANMKAEFEKMTTMFSEMKSEPIRELADDEYVMSWMRFTGKFSQDMMGKKAGESFTSESMEVSKFKDGKTIEHWTMMEPKELMKMMGGETTTTPPPMEEKPAKDSTSK